MRISIKRIWRRLLEFLRLSPLSLAEKCRLTFGAAVLLVLVIALLLPYIWMGQLTKKALLDSDRAKAETLLFRLHFQLKETGEAGLAALDNTGMVLDVNDPEISWIRFPKGDEDILQKLTREQRGMIESLKAQEDRDDRIELAKKNGVLQSTYVRIFRANDNCISCHHQRGTASPFERNQAIGAAVIQHPADEISKTALMNRVWIIVAGLIAGTGAIVAFYVITQRVILRPIRQLRALANNVAEGNLDIRSAIKTGDEYEKLANAFNNMLDGLQSAHEQLRVANKQLDSKIAELSDRNIELFKANKLKGEFLANISHEFRTPLNAILGFAQVLRDKPGVLTKDKTHRYADHILTSGNRLLTMINDLLDLAKSEAGKLALHIEPTSVSDLLDTVVSFFAVLTKQKRIKVRVEVDPGLPVLRTDAGKLQHIMYNFLSNAVKFTPPHGRIKIRASMSGVQTVRISVSDTGCGISSSDRSKIFEKFVQSDGSLTRPSSGSGLGLSISKSLASLLAGNIGFESEPDKGSTFWLDIPVTLTKNEKQSAS